MPAKSRTLTTRTRDATVSPNVTDAVIQLNLSDSLAFTDADIAERFVEYINVMGVGTVSELLDIEVPRTEDGLDKVLDEYRATADLVEDVGDCLAAEEDELHDAVFDLYGLSTSPVN